MDIDLAGLQPWDLRRWPPSVDRVLRKLGPFRCPLAGRDMGHSPEAT